jgi:hypothetical protein
VNIFFLDQDHKLAAQAHNDKHVVKMILESAQVLSTVCRAHGYDVGYKSTHARHPCTLWAGKNASNFLWLANLASHLNTEWRWRFTHFKDHKSFDVIKTLPDPYSFLPDEPMTTPALAMPDDCKCDDPVESYRNYYRQYKQHLAKWTRRGQPEWWYQ